MRIVTDTDITYASPFLMPKNVEHLIRQYKGGKKIAVLANLWDVSPTCIAFQLEKAGVRIPKKRGI